MWLRRLVPKTLLLATAVALLQPVVGVMAQDFSSGYRSETDLPTGIAVSLVSEDTRDIEPANESNTDDLLGVVVGGTGSLMMLSTEESNVQVVTSGVTEVLVTDTFGDIEAGDHITTSSVNGVGRLADSNDSKVLGVAREDFQDATVRTVTTESGDIREVAVARIPVLIQVGGNPESARQETFLPGFIQEGANAVAGEPVAPGRIIIGLLVITGGIVGAMVLLYGAVSSTIISIGRNPLSDASIYAGLFRMIMIALGIIGLSVGIAYLIVVGP